MNQIGKEIILKAKRIDGTIIPAFSIEWVNGRIRMFRLNEKGETIGSERVKNVKDAKEKATGICNCCRLTPINF